MARHDPLCLQAGSRPAPPLQDNLGSGATQTVRTTTGNFNQRVVSLSATRRIRSLTLGSSSVPDLTAVALSRRAAFDTDGLIPASLFHSVFISSRGGLVVLNPSFPKTNRDAQMAMTAK